MSEEAMRKAFEAWALVSGRTEKQLRRLSNGDYEVTATHWEWQAWQAATRAAVPAGLSFEGAIRLARGCADYGGGHHGDAYDAFQHGIQTVVNVLVAAQKNGLSEYQIAVLHAIGSEVKS